jgi:hypothetical protein
MALELRGGAQVASVQESAWLAHQRTCARSSLGPLLRRARQSLVLLLAEDCAAEELMAVWRALEAVCGAIPKEDLPEYVNTLKVRCV